MGESQKLFATRASTIGHPNWLKRLLRCALLVLACLVVLCIWSSTVQTFTFPLLAYCDEATEANNNETATTTLVFFMNEDADPRNNNNTALGKPVVPSSKGDGLWWRARALCEYGDSMSDDNQVMFTLVFLTSFIAPIMWLAIKSYGFRENPSRASVCWGRLDNLITGSGANLMISTTTSFTFHSSPDRYEIPFGVAHMTISFFMILPLCLITIPLCCRCCRCRCLTRGLFYLFLGSFIFSIGMSFIDLVLDNRDGFGSVGVDFAMGIALAIPSPGPLVGLQSAAVIGPLLFAIEAIESIFDDKIPVLGLSLRGYGKVLRKQMHAGVGWDDDEQKSEPTGIATPAAVSV